MVIDKDPSVFALSAWNDNGFIGRVGGAYDLMRTTFFPGLGWMLPRTLYKQELEPAWPMSHWDHWLRSKEISKNRVVIHPSVPRSYHNGVRGTFMNLDTHNRYFRDIAYNMDPTVSWATHMTAQSVGGATLPHYMTASRQVYDLRLQALIHSCANLQNVAELEKFHNSVLCIWITSDYSNQDFEAVSRYFGIWHEFQRGAHGGLHEFFFHSNHVLLLNVKDKYVSGVDTYARLRPPALAPLRSRAFS
jgi:beta-1,2-N-acetylglucosaminyltransferase